MISVETVLGSHKSRASLPARLHADQSGSISISAVFGVLFLTFLLGLVMNSSFQVDQKVKMQNAADAATYAGAVAIGRSMNSLAFTNHLMCDIFALTAYLRAARDRSAESLVPEILDNWERVGGAFAGSEFHKFSALGLAIPDKVAYERELVGTFSEWAAAGSELMLPVFEQILAEERIPEYQRDLVAATPQLAQTAVEEVARRHGEAWPRGTHLEGVLWRTDAQLLVGTCPLDPPLLPVVDPLQDDAVGWHDYLADARDQRFELAHRYLRHWNNESLLLFDQYAKMSQFSSLWRIFSGGHLQRLLNQEYPDRNLPIQILHRANHGADLNAYLERHHMVIGVVYRKRMGDRFPGIFRNPVTVDTSAYAQAMIFVPRRRLVHHWPGTYCRQCPRTRTGIPGQSLMGGALPHPSPPPPDEERNGEDEIQPLVVRQSERFYPEPWSLVNQNWTAQLVPATCERIPEILSTPLPSCSSSTFDLPAPESLGPEDFLWLSNH